MDLDLGTGPAADGEWFAPDYADNRRRPEAEQGQLFCTRINGRELTKLRNGELKRVSGQTKEQARAAAVAFEQRFKMRVLNEHVTQVRNWFAADETGQRVELKTVQQIVDLLSMRARKAKAAEEFIDQVFDFIIGESTLTEDLESE